MAVADQSQYLINASDPKLIKLNRENEASVALVPQSGGELTDLTAGGAHSSISVIFPILHGPFGEDGTVQGLLKLAGVPFVGASVLSSAIAMDKDIMKRLLRDAGIPIGEYLAFKRGDLLDFDAISNELGLPLFVKPANLGSSVGVHKVTDRETFERAIEDAFTYDLKILIEEFIDGRELECAVLGNRNPKASVVGEIVPATTSIPTKPNISMNRAQRWRFRPTSLRQRAIKSETLRSAHSKRSSARALAGSIVF